MKTALAYCFGILFLISPVVLPVGASAQSLDPADILSPETGFVAGVFG